MDKPKKLILDYSKWICGDGGPNKLGKGKVALKNEQGFFCCLGLWSVQLGVPEDELLNHGEPQELKTIVPLFAKEDNYKYIEFNPITGEDDEYVESCGNINTELAGKAIGINDDVNTTPEQKIELLYELLAKEGIELEVINKPD